MVGALEDFSVTFLSSDVTRAVKKGTLAWMIRAVVHLKQQRRTSSRKFKNSTCLFYYNAKATGKLGQNVDWLFRASKRAIGHERQCITSPLMAVMNSSEYGPNNGQKQQLAFTSQWECQEWKHLLWFAWVYLPPETVWCCSLFIAWSSAIPEATPTPGHGRRLNSSGLSSKWAVLLPEFY